MSLIEEPSDEELEAMKAAEAWQSAGAYGTGIGSVVGTVGGAALGLGSAAIPVAGPALAAIGTPALAAGGAALGATVGGMAGQAIGGGMSAAEAEKANKEKQIREAKILELEARSQALQALLPESQKYL